MRRAAIGCLLAPFVVAAIVMMVVGVALATDNLSRVRTHAEVEGVIVDLIASVDADGDTLYQPVVAYTVDGSPYRVESRTRHGGAFLPQIGDVRIVVYDPEDPADAVVGGFWSLWLAPLLLVSIPALLIGGAFWAAARTRRRAARGDVPGASSGDEGVETTQQWANGEGSVAVEEIPSLDFDARIEALFMGVEPSPMDDRGRVRYRVRARGDVEGQPLRFYSDWLAEDPTLLLMEAGNRVVVWFDRADPRRYRMVLPTAAG